MAKDRHEEALNILAKYHANGNINDPTVQFEYREIKQTIKMEIEAKTNSSYADFFKTKGNRYRFIILISLGIFSQWSGNAIISNYVSKLYDQAGILDSNSKLGVSHFQHVSDTCKLALTCLRSFLEAKLFWRSLSLSPQRLPLTVLDGDLYS
jgi:hypothetical protein